MIPTSNPAATKNYKAAPTFVLFLPRINCMCFIKIITTHLNFSHSATASLAVDQVPRHSLRAILSSKIEKRPLSRNVSV